MAADTHNTILVVHGTGAGKTLTALATAVNLRRSRPAARVVIMAPRATLSNWRIEYQRFFGPIPVDDILFLTHNAFIKKQYLIGVCRGAILIIDEVHNLRTHVASKDDVKGETSLIKAWLKEKKMPLDKSIIPSYVYRQRSSPRTFTVMLAAEISWKVILLSATPIINNASSDMRNIYTLLHQSTQPQNTKFLMKDYNISYHRPEKGEGFPGETIINQEIPLTATERIRYKALVHGLEPDWQHDLAGSSKMVIFNHLRQAGDAGFQVYFSPKIKFILKKMREDRGKKKTLIYTNWLKLGVDVVKKSLLQHIPETKVSIITGGTRESDIKQILADYNSANSHVTLIISAAGREGINLRGVRNVFLLEPGWNNANKMQALARAIRFRSHEHLPPDERNVTVYNLLLKDTVDTDLELQYVNKKEALARVWDSEFKRMSIR